MNVILAKTAGFCFGVKRAVDTVYKEIEKNKPIYTFGPIIHNEIVVKDLEEKGVKVVSDLKELDDIKSGTIIIRSHGVSKSVYESLCASNLEIVDATCPFVKKIHNVVEKESLNSKIVIIGNPNHPEVEGIKGWCISEPVVIENADEALEFSRNNNCKICVVSQTTFNYNKFKELVDIISNFCYDVNIVNTICNATEERQNEARKIASIVDSMIVIGSKSSSNTQKLYEICSKECMHTQYVQTLDDLVVDSSVSLSCVGITAGASTPNKIIEEVQNHVRINF